MFSVIGSVLHLIILEVKIHGKCFQGQFMYFSFFFFEKKKIMVPLMLL